MKKIFSPQTRALFGLSLGHFNIDLYAALIVPLYPFLTKKLGMDLAVISFIIAAGHLVSSMMQPVFGFIADKLRHRLFMVWGLVLASICTPLTVKANNAMVFTSLLMLGMVGNAFFHPQVTALINDFNKNNPNLTRAMGVFLGLGTIGYAIGPYISTVIVQHAGESALLYMFIPGLLSCIFLYFFVPKVPSRECYKKENFFFIMKEIMKNKTCLFLTFISIMKSAVSISFGTYIPFLLQNKGFSLSDTGFVVTMFFIAGGIATIISSKIEKYINANGIVVLSFLSILPLTLLFLYTIDKNIYFAVAIFILTGFFILLSVGVILVHAQKAMPQYMGVVSGVMQGFSWGIGALFLAPLGLIGKHYNVEAILLIMSSLVFLIGLYTVKYKCLKNDI